MSLSHTYAHTQNRKLTKKGNVQHHEARWPGPEGNEEATNMMVQGNPKTIAPIRIAADGQEFAEGYWC